MLPTRLLGRLVALAMSLAVLAVASACSTGQPAPQASTHPVEQEFGTTQVPDRPTSVVALDEYAAMNMLALGTTPKVVFTAWGSHISQTVLHQAGSELVRIPVGSTIQSTTVLGHNPDLVVFTSIGDRTLYDALAPTVATLPLPSTTTAWREAITTTGAALGRQAQARHVVDALNGQLTQVKQARAASSPRTMAVLIPYGGQLTSASGDAPSTTLLAETGFDTPAPEKATDPNHQPYLALSPENLVDHDADVIAILDEGVYDADAVRTLPTFARLRGTAVDVNGDMWSGAFPFAVYWTTADLGAIARGDVGALGKEQDAAARYARFRQLIG